MDNLLSNTLEFIGKGKSGKNKGFDFTISKMNRYVKIWAGRYYLYFALSGVGKSKFVYHQHIFNVIDQQINKNIVDKLNIDLYSLEISPVTVSGIMLIFYLHKYKKIITDTNQLFSYENKISDKLYKVINSSDCKNYMEKFNKYINIYTSLDFNGLITNTEKYLKANGEMTKSDNKIVSYNNKYDKQLYEIIIDHISLTKLIHGKNRYETIGIISKYLFAMRNIANLTPVIIQQVKPNKTKKPEDLVSPSHEDLRDSPETFNDSDVSIALGNPYKHKIKNYNGYKIFPNNLNDGLQDRLRIIEMRKNRYGAGANHSIPSLFIGETSEYFNIKKPQDLTNEEYLKINNLKKTYD